MGGTKFVLKRILNKLRFTSNFPCTKGIILVLVKKIQVTEKHLHPV